MIHGHGDDSYRYTVNFKANFSSNVWFEGTSEKLLKHLTKQLPLIAKYPAPSADSLVKKIKDHHSIDTNEVIVTNGATEAFYLIASIFSKKSVGVCIPTFSEYEDAAMTHQLKITHYNRENILTTTFTDDLVFICNPNNPDGRTNTVTDIEFLLAKHPKTIFVIDEAYIEFTNTINSCIELLKSYSNLIIVKSLTKLFSIPGIRLGYLITNPLLFNKMNRHKMPWNVNTLAIEAGSFIFDNYSILLPEMNILLKLSKKLQNQINAITGFHVLPSSTNYFLIKLDKPIAAKLKSYLIEDHQILIRDASNFKGLDQHYIRIASQNDEKNQLLINALHQWNFI